MQVTGRAGPFLRLGKDCGDCETFAENVTEIYDRGGTVETAGVRILSVKRAGGNGDVTQYTVQAQAAPTKIHKRAGGIRRLPGGRETYEYFVMRTGAGWRMQRFGSYAE